MNAVTEFYELQGREIAVRREDLRVGAPFIPHGKTLSIIQLIKSLAEQSSWQLRQDGVISGVSCFASRGSDWALNAAIAARACGLPLTIYAQQPSAKLRMPLFLQRARDLYDARIEFVRANHTQIMSAQAHKRAAERGDFFIPFGLELPLVMDELTQRLRGFDKTATIVLCAGSGITLVCLLKAALLDHKRFEDVRIVSSGRATKAIRAMLERHISPLEMSQLTRHAEIIPGHYGDECTLESAWPTHPFYERKAYAWLVEHISQLEEPISFLNM